MSWRISSTVGCVTHQIDVLRRAVYDHNTAQVNPFTMMAHGINFPPNQTVFIGGWLANSLSSTQISVSFQSDTLTQLDILAVFRANGEGINGSGTRLQRNHTLTMTAPWRPALATFIDLSGINRTGNTGNARFTVVTR